MQERPVQSGQMLREFARVKHQLVDPPFVILAQVDDVANATSTPDTGCNVASLVNGTFARRNGLEREQLPMPREIKAYDD